MILKSIEELGHTDLILSPEDSLNGKKEIDPSKIVYQSERFDLKEAAKRENAGKPRSKFIERYPVQFILIHWFGSAISLIRTMSQ